MLRIEHLTKHYKGSNKGVTDISLHVEKGDIYAFIGHNGAGKTTLVKLLLRLYDADGRLLSDRRTYPNGDWTEVTPDSGYTFHGYGKESTEKIDYIYVRGNLECKGFEKWTVCENGVYLSDHYPVCADLKFK